MRVSVILPTHNPDAGRLRRTLAGLAQQTLPASEWELLLIDNASSPAVDVALPPNGRIAREPQVGLTWARRRGFNEAAADVAILVDDDNVLAPDYLAAALSAFERLPPVGLLGGRSLPEFETAPPEWTREFHPLLAVRDLGAEPRISKGLRPAGSARNEYPLYAPIGAGMALRRAAWQAWINRGHIALTDRRGAELTSGGDNDIVLSAMAAGWEVAYLPGLSLTHLIPSGRLQPDYLGRLNYGIQKSWMQVLRLHEANPWPPLSRLGARLRKAKAWGTCRPWRSLAARVRWQGARGHFDGRVLAA